MHVWAPAGQEGQSGTCSWEDQNCGEFPRGQSSVFWVKRADEVDKPLGMHAGALYGICPEACLYYFGLSWWAVWFQFIILLVSVPVGVRPQAL